MLVSAGQEAHCRPSRQRPSIYPTTEAAAAATDACWLAAPALLFVAPASAGLPYMVHIADGLLVRSRQHRGFLAGKNNYEATHCDCCRAMFHSRKAEL